MFFFCLARFEKCNCALTELALNLSVSIGFTPGGIENLDIVECCNTGDMHLLRVNGSFLCESRSLVNSYIIDYQKYFSGFGS